ncbi:Aminomethyltransferase folate-binding domain-containing protein [Coprinellus micaceus]|uniref:Aminomethyltransferase folate-binding domain-containing protein n=1 Tax=Coprinellus micaceus TaxID=71717 RepID=A0A4Y7T4F6_COPMI|nr:Aminomethyltransferase folate-binding domain-containing protein [Coprinellus micaceus]
MAFLRSFSTVQRCIRAGSFYRTLYRGYASSSTPLRKTGLYDFHVSNGAKMVPFAGYSMPLAYGDVGQVASHNHVRQKVGLFDFREWLTPSSLSTLPSYSSTLSVLLNEKGVSSTILSSPSMQRMHTMSLPMLPTSREKLEEWNASEQGKVGPVEMESARGLGPFGLAGSEAASYLQKPQPLFDLRQLTFGKSAFVPIEGFNLHVARGATLGKMGFEPYLAS